MKNTHIIPDDTSTTLMDRGTECCGGKHQTIAGALLRSKYWDAWYKHASENKLFDVDETQECGEMGYKHFDEFIKFCKTI